MKVLENMYVTTRAYRAHFDFPYSQVMERVTRRVKEKTASFLQLVVEGEVWRFGEKKNSKTLEVG